MFRCKRRLILLLSVLLVTVCLTAPAGATEIRSGQLVTVPEGKIRGPLFAAGSNVVIDADVDGDVFITGQSVTVNGRINGDLLAAARSIAINGTVVGDIRCAAEDVNLRGETGQSLTVFAGTFRGMDASRINRDLLLFSGYVDLAGTVGGQVLGTGGNISLNGLIGGDVDFWGVQQLQVGPAAVIGGNLVYSSENEAVLSPGANIAGSYQWEQAVKPQIQKRQEGFNWLGQLAWFAAGVLVWGVFVLLFPRLWIRLSEIVKGSPGPAFGWGLLVLLTVPLAVLLLLITVIGIPVSLLLLAAYLAVLSTAKIIIGDTLGRFLSRYFGWEGRVPSILPFLVGFLVLVLLSNIPVVGFFTELMVVCLALGAVSLAFYYWRKDALHSES